MRPIEDPHALQFNHPLNTFLPRLETAIEGGTITGFTPDGTPVIEGGRIVFRDPRTGDEVLAPGERRIVAPTTFIAVDAGKLFPPAV
ncbi:MAG TPA: hypothetical protein PLB89_18175 [Flavobacteriales bacterium]|nr:hypothetical protein [Flavobacteriales bacterium]